MIERILTHVGLATARIVAAPTSSIVLQAAQDWDEADQAGQRSWTQAGECR